MKQVAVAVVPDGQAWSLEAARQIEDDVLALFSTPQGERVLGYLRKITTGRVLGPGASDAELRDLEGRRALVAIIDMRMANGRERRKQSRTSSAAAG